MTRAAPTDRLGDVVKAILDLRLFAVAVTLLYLPSLVARPGAVIVALLASLLCSAVPLLLWGRISGTVLRHPTWLAVDLALSVAVLALAGPESPFFLATLATAALAGIMYGATGAAVFTFLLLAGWAAVLHLRPAGADELSTFEATVTLPALYPLCAAAGAAVRRLLDTQAATERRLVAAEHANAVAAERARMAREMHDSVGKSLHGIAMSATALAMNAERGDAGDAAQQLAGAAKVAAHEARELIGDLRADDLDAELRDALATVAGSWAQSSGVAVTLDLSPVDADADVRYELLAIAREALRNVERHAAASSVRIGLSERDGRVRLSIADDGRGPGPERDLERLAAAGHYGLLGMRERAERLGGSLSVESPSAGGTTIAADVPATTPAGPADDPARARRRLRLRRGLEEVPR